MTKASQRTEQRWCPRCQGLRSQTVSRSERQRGEQVVVVEEARCLGCGMTTAIREDPVPALRVVHRARPRRWAPPSRRPAP